MSISSYLSLCVVALTVGGPSEAHQTNPRIAKATDDSLKWELEYLIFDLGKGIELKLVKIPAKRKSFTIGSTSEEQE